MQQVGVGIPGACEAIAEAVRLYLFDPEAEGASEQQQELSCVVFSFDVRNAFNSIDRRVVVSEVAARIPALLHG